MVEVFTTQERAAVEAAVAEAERRTGAELVVMATARATDYRAEEMTAAAIAALSLPALLLFDASIPALTIWVAQLVLFVTLGFLLPLLRFGRFVVGERRLAADVRSAAEAEFFAHGLRNTGTRAAVLIYVAKDERRVEVLCDDAAAEAVGEAEWRGLAGDLARRMKAGEMAAGLEAAARRAGDLLAPHFPRASDDENELPDVIVR